MKTQTTLLFLLGLTGVAFAQDTPVQATTDAQTETPTSSDTVATGHAVTQDVTGRTVFVTSQRPAPSPHDYRAEFDAMDSNGDGSISRNEAGADKYLARTFATYDSDRNDRLSFEETRRWLED